jgi:hypothetical protein
MYLVLPQEVYSGGSIVIEYYIKKILEKYHVDYTELPYLLYSKNELEDICKEKSISMKKCINEILDEDSDNYLDKKGNIITTRVKDSYYDWYEIGGRWNGIVNDNQKSEEKSEQKSENMDIKNSAEKSDSDDEDADEEKKDDDSEEDKDEKSDSDEEDVDEEEYEEEVSSLISNNTRKISDLLQNIKQYPCSVCDKNGIIHAEIDEKQSYDILKEYPDDYVIVIDYHA